MRRLLALRLGVFGCVMLGCACGAAQPALAQNGEGVCRNGSSGPNCPGANPLPCDQNAIKNAKAEFQKWLNVWLKQSSMVDQLSKQEGEVFQEASAVFDEQFSAVEGAGEFVQEGSFHGIEKAVGSVGSESMAESVGEGLAAITIAKMERDMTLGGAKMISKLNESKKYANQGASTAQAADNALQQTNAAKAKLDQLEAACKQSPSNPSPKADNTIPGTNAQSWQTIASASDDAINQMTAASNDIAQALSVVQSAQGASSSDAAPGDGYSASLLRVKYMAGGTSAGKLSPADLAKFVPPMASAYTAIAKAGQDWEAISAIMTAPASH